VAAPPVPGAERSIPVPEPPVLAPESTAAPAATEPVPVSAPAPAETHRDERGEQGYLEFDGLLQTQVIVSFDDNEPYAHLGEARTGIRLRRAELELHGSPGRGVSFQVEVDLAQVREFKATDIGGDVTIAQPASPVSMLEDLKLTYDVGGVEVTIGQGKVPSSLDGLSSSRSLLLAERSEVGRKFGGNRDIGVWAHHRYHKLAYVIGLYHGAGPNVIDGDEYKGLRARVEFTPNAALLLAVSGRRTLASPGTDTTTLGGADVRFERGAVLGQGELYYQDDGGVVARGGYAALGYRLSAAPELQLGARYDLFDPDADTEGDDYMRATVGLNYDLRIPSSHFQLNYVHSQGAESVTNDVVIAVAQTGF
jgi:phosphate-selective porin